MNKVVEMPISSSNLQAMQAGQWQAFLNLHCQSSTRGTRLISCKHRGPLYIQKAFYPEGKQVAHLYLLHPPGGLVSGDILSINVTIDTDSKALITTPGAGRIYGAREDKKPQRIINQLDIANNASLEWFPLETIIFNGANGQSNTLVELQENSQFIGWDICCLGLPASQAPFEQGSIKQRFEITRHGMPEVIEQLNFTATDVSFLNSPAGLSGYSCSGFMAIGPFTKEQCASDEYCQLIESLQAYRINDALVGISRVKDWILVRYLGHSSEQAKQCFIHCWQKTRPLLLNKKACLPRIWAC